ncbi:MAG: 1-(5-phosphoribosyl)-5-amino-4-imidazole-carboxylate carboxylase, partial [Deltaproteobacteria bacterium]|nr:1-(5-phosphoribosyl)-5-amino-4-imidazole-carboxylate carboxylase [Deltaproteobacteria bacterium]
MNVKILKKLIEDIKKNRISTDGALERLKILPFEELEFATLDSHRSLRQGFPEVIFGQGKTIAQIGAIIRSMLKRKENVLITRLDKKKAKALV